MINEIWRSPKRKERLEQKADNKLIEYSMTGQYKTRGVWSLSGVILYLFLCIYYFLSFFFLVICLYYLLS